MRDWSDFTEKKYSNLLKLAQRKYRFVAYNEDIDAEDIVLWRHDVDFSLCRSVRLAELERDCGVASTYFLQLNSIGYNLFEMTARRHIRKIRSMGHHFGLHFDPFVYKGESKEAVLAKMQWEKNILKELLETEIHSVSFHNPEFDNWLSIDSHYLCGMVNTYSHFFQQYFGYCSDSNGYWRFESLESVLCDKKYSRLQVLTHPEWWTPDALSPRKRIQRCFEGRAKSCLDTYDEALRVMGRKNIDE